MGTPREKFQELLKKLFQFDSADLDFGIYRIMNQKRLVIERFIEKELLDGVAAELSTGALATESGLAQHLEDVRAKIRENFGDDALDSEGNLVKYADSPRGQQYLELRNQAGNAKSRPELEASIFNHLYAFFSRYYDEGDFMSLRRYSKRDKYAIPYNGEEVYLHWANADQYYIKTGETFTDYTYTHGGWTVHFKLRNADVEQNNVRGAKRFFVPRAADAAVDEAARSLTIPFEYRPLSTDEEIRYAQKKKGEAASANSKPKPPGEAAGKKKKGQEGILIDAIAAIESVARTNTEALAALLHEKRKDAEGNPVSLLEHHLRIYTRNNTSDFFIHKDLKGFLERELSFYLKNEVLNLDELETGGEARSKSWFQTLRAIKVIGSKIIAFVAQIENFQKRLFEKRKFVTDVNYCVTLDRVPERLYAEIAKNKTQIEEWKKYFHIHQIQGDLATPGFNEPLKTDFLRAHKRLVLNTEHFTQSFKDDLLAELGALDSDSLGVAVNADNFQGLAFLANILRGDVRMFYIDPPYNTGSDDFVYKDNYQHSTWLCMLESRLQLAKHFLTDNGLAACHLNDIEAWRFRGLISRVFDSASYICTVVTKCSTVSSFRTVNLGPVDVTDQVILFARDRVNIAYTPQYVEKAEIDLEHFSRFVVNKKDPPSKWAFKPVKLQVLQDLGYDCSSSAEGMRLAKKKYGEAAEIVVRRESEKFVLNNAELVFETKTLQKPSTWLREHIAKSAENPEKIFELKRDDDEPILLLAGRQFYFLSRSVQVIDGVPKLAEPVSTLWLDIDTNNLRHEGGVDFENGKKPLKLLMRLIGMSSRATGRYVLDFFAGSGSTGHAVINLRQSQKLPVQFALIEGSDYFHTTTVRRLQNVLYSSEWRANKPSSQKGVSGFFKFLRLESYEDALDNISFQSTNDQSMLQLEDYVLSYLLDFETKHSDTLLNVAKLDSPFDYKLHRHGTDHPQPVDLPETFNYLIGLHVLSRTVHYNKDTRYLVYRGKAEGKTTVIIWRTTRGWGKREFETDSDFIAKQKLTEGAEDVLVNTDSYIHGARSLDPAFKRRMFSEV